MRNPTEKQKNGDMKITVKTNDGELYEKKEITTTPFGDNNELVNFWMDDSVLRTIPIQNVAYVDLHFEND